MNPFRDEKEEEMLNNLTEITNHLKDLPITQQPKTEHKPKHKVEEKYYIASTYNHGAFADDYQIFKGKYREVTLYYSKDNYYIGKASERFMPYKIIEEPNEEFNIYREPVEIPKAVYEKLKDNLQKIYKLRQMFNTTCKVFLKID